MIDEFIGIHNSQSTNQLFNHLFSETINEVR